MPNKTLAEMFKNGTDAEISEYLNTGRVPESYQNRYKPQNYTFWNGGRVNEGFKIDDASADTWKRIASLYSAGDVNGAMDLVNGLSGKGTFGGYYDDNGQYWGFAQGYMGGANASFQPVLGGKLMTTGLDTTGTDIWLTPDGKALKMGQGGTLTDRGDTWSRTRQVDPAEYRLRQLEAQDTGRQTGLPALPAAGQSAPGAGQQSPSPPRRKPPPGRSTWRATTAGRLPGGPGRAMIRMRIPCGRSTLPDTGTGRPPGGPGGAMIRIRTPCGGNTWRGMRAPRPRPGRAPTMCIGGMKRRHGLRRPSPMIRRLTRSMPPIGRPMPGRGSGRRRIPWDGMPP